MKRVRAHPIMNHNRKRIIEELSVHNSDAIVLTLLGKNTRAQARGGADAAEEEEEAVDDGVRTA